MYIDHDSRTCTSLYSVHRRDGAHHLRTVLRHFVHGEGAGGASSRPRRDPRRAGNEPVPGIQRPTRPAVHRGDDLGDPEDGQCHPEGTAAPLQHGRAGQGALCTALCYAIISSSALRCLNTRPLADRPLHRPRGPHCPGEFRHPQQVCERRVGRAGEVRSREVPRRRLRKGVSVA